MRAPDSIFNWTVAAAVGLIAIMLPAALYGAEAPRPQTASEADFGFLENLELEVGHDLGSSSSGLATSGPIPGEGCGCTPCRRVTTSRMYSGSPIGGPLDLAANPEIQRPGPLEYIDPSLLRGSTEEEARPQYAISGGGWCFGSRCGLGGQGLGVPSSILSFYSNQSPSQRPFELRGINLNGFPRHRTARMEQAWARPGGESSEGASIAEELDRECQNPKSKPPAAQGRVFRVTEAEQSFSIPLEDLGIGADGPIEIKGTIRLAEESFAPRSPIIWLGYDQPREEWKSPCGLKLNGKNGRSLLETPMGDEGRHGAVGKMGWWKAGEEVQFSLSLGTECSLELKAGTRVDRVFTAAPRADRPSRIYIGIPQPMDRKRCPGGCWRTPMGTVVTVSGPASGAPPARH